MCYLCVLTALALSSGSAVPVAHPVPEAIPASVPVPEQPTLTDIRGVGSAALFLGGAATAFVLHESSHVLANLAYGNVPTFKGILYAHFIPFFTVSPGVTCVTADNCSRRDGHPFGGGAHGLYVINTAGLQEQNLSSELLLTLKPQLRYERSPYLKGFLFFNTLLSMGYATASVLNVEDPHGDVAGARRSSNYPRAFLAATIFLPGALDLYRYVFPESKWAPWVSRGTKALFLGMNVKF